MAKPGVGQSKAALAARKAANKGVKAGTVRKGAAGKYDRKWNAQTARWEIVGARKSTAAKYVAGVKKAAATNRAKAKPGMTTAQYAASKAKRTTPSQLTGLAAKPRTTKPATTSSSSDRPWWKGAEWRPSSSSSSSKPSSPSVPKSRPWWKGAEWKGK